jgi:hypothetical protein
VKGWLGIGANVWDSSGLENIALDVFSKRSQELEQTVHELVMREGTFDQPSRSIDGTRKLLSLGVTTSLASKL